MSRTRSPNYPVMDLKAAVSAVAPIFAREKRNKMPREIAAKHLGYTGLNGRSLGVIGALRAYGLLEGTGDDTRVSDDAITLLNAPEQAADWTEALKRCAERPALFRELRGKFPESLPSDGVLRYTLIKMGFNPDAADKATQTYLATMALVGDSDEPYNPPSNQEETIMVPGVGEVDRRAAEQHAAMPRPLDISATHVPVAGSRSEVITLDEGDVVIVFPENLSAESFADLKDHLDLFVKKMQRRAGRKGEEAAH